MDLRGLTKLVLKLGGVWVLVIAVTAIPSFLTTPTEYVGAGYITIAILLVVALVLIFFPGVLVNRLLLVAGPDLDSAVTFESLLRVGLLLLGVYFTATAMFDAAYTWAGARWFYVALLPFPGSRGPEITPEHFAQLVAALVKFVAGVVLWVGAPLLARISGRFR